MNKQAIFSNKKILISLITIIILFFSAIGFSIYKKQSNNHSSIKQENEIITENIKENDVQKNVPKEDLVAYYTHLLMFETIDLKEHDKQIAVVLQTKYSKDLLSILTQKVVDVGCKEYPNITNAILVEYLREDKKYDFNDFSENELSRLNAIKLHCYKA